MHRSGTSAFSGVACALGASAPNTLLPASSANAHGYWESLPLLLLHNELLASADSSWDDWRRLDPKWYDSLDAQRFRGRLQDVLRSEFEQKPLFVVKDPRLCRFMPFFLNVLQDMAVAPVGLFALRDPLEVAFSLRRRDGFPIAKSVALWLRHVLEAELHSRKLPRCIVLYENLLKDWRLEMSRAGEKIGVVWPTAFETSAISIENFLATDLHHEKNESKELEKHPDLLFLAAETYRLLCMMSTSEADRDLFAKLDAVHAKFNEASDFFGAILRDEELAAQQLRLQLNQKSSELEQQQATIDQQNARQQKLADENHQKEIERSEYVTQLGKLNNQLLEQLARHQQELARQNRQKETERLGYVAQLCKLSGELEELRDISAKNETRLTELSAELDRKKDEHGRLIADLESSKNARDDLQARLAASRDFSERLAGKLAELGGRHKELQAEGLKRGAIIDSINREIATQKSEIATQKSKVEDLLKVLAERDDKNRGLQAEIDAFYRSRSWRMTGPFRALRRFFLQE